MLNKSKPEDVQRKERIQELKSQIEAGTYKVDSKLIAEKMFDQLKGEIMMSALPLLKKSLENLLREHQSLLQLADEKKKILISGKANELTPIIAKETMIINKIRQFETERQGYTMAFLQSKSLNENLSLKETLPYIDDPTERCQISKLRDELKTVMVELKNLNDLNQQLIKQSLSYVHLSMDLMTQNHQPSPTYGNPQHQAARRNNQSIFDSKI